MLVLLALLGPMTGATTAPGSATPLERSGLTPVWWENFTDMNIANMQWAYALPPQDHINSYVIPGAVYLGQISTGGSSEHQINHHNYTGDEPFSHTVEFDMYQALPGSGTRIFVRHHWSENGVFIHLDGDPSTFVDFQDIKAIPGEHNYVYYDAAIGHGQWAHIVVSFLQDFDGDTLETVVAINDQVKQYTMDSRQLVDLETTAWPNRREVWSFEFYGERHTSGVYLANFRGYVDFLDEATLQTMLTPQVIANYVAGLPTPNTDQGQKWLLPRNSSYVGDLEKESPLAIISTNWVDGTTVQLDAGASQAWRTITEIRWDWESDGVWDVISDDGVQDRVVTHTYPEIGDYTVTLGITRTEYTSSGDVFEYESDTDTVRLKLIQFYLPVVLR